MTHPFPLSDRLPHMKALDVECQCGVAHNGIIRLTSDPSQREYSDTALFITRYIRLVAAMILQRFMRAGVICTIWLATSKTMDACCRSAAAP